MEFQTGGFLPETPPDAGGEFAAPRSGFLFKVFRGFIFAELFFWIFCSIMADMSKEMIAIVAGFVTMMAGFIAVLAFLWSISRDIGDIRQQLGANTAAISANTAAIAELRGAMLAHVGGHSHSSKVAVSDSE